MQMGFYFDQSRCTGCYTCCVACKDWNDIPAGPVNFRKVTSREWGRYPEVKLAYLSLSCNHCGNPRCAQACPASAITKREEDGIVLIDRDICLGSDVCGMPCKQACPYGVPQFGIEENPRMQMCHFCLDRLKENKKPACVDSCPVRALDAGPLDELRKKYGQGKEAEGFSYSEETMPSIIVKPRYTNIKGSKIRGFKGSSEKD
jgi:anaerobic dimethyl sulfoxide reductase subunit B (iron-sulfur subunit)